jgi:Niemann-Pick C1 protein
MYSAWDTNKVIAVELVRNLALALGCVFIIILILLVNIKLCFMVLITVVLTLVDVLGMIYFWGLSIDTIVCMSVVLVVGLCVDYSAHIILSFCMAKGTTSLERASTALITIGPAILNGGTTTFLALVFLGFSNSFAYIVMFKARQPCIIIMM